uniref:Type III pantothenate kinase n=1 Tax=candidate division WOR-3 bacterium TaxID=2052148 RepID=A0A7C4GG68_UNCW3
MTLVVLVGNSNTRVALFSGRRLIGKRVIATARIHRHPACILALTSAHQPATDSALASVVPALTRPVARILARNTDKPPLVVDARTRTGLSFRYNRRQLGVDRVCTAVGAIQRYQRDTIVVDFGTATTINIITAAGVFLGGTILPGAEMMLRALAHDTARLPAVSFIPRHRAIGHDTSGAIRSGVFHLLAGGVARIIDRIRSETGRDWLIVATGGGAGIFRRHIPAVTRIDPDIAVRGLAALLQINRRESAPHQKHSYRRSA